MEPHTNLGKYRMVLGLFGLHNIQEGPHNTVRAETTFRKIPEGLLFVQTDCCITWREPKGGFEAIIHLYPAFYKMQKAWLLSEIYDFEGNLENQKIIAQDEGAKLYSEH